MKDQQKRSLGIRVLNAMCAVVLIASLIWLFRGGAEFIATAVAVSALVGVAAPAVISGDGVWSVLASILEAIVDGIAALVEAMVNVIAGLFG